MNRHDHLGISEPAPFSPTRRIYRLDRITGFDADRFHHRPLTSRILTENIARNFDPKLLDASAVRTLVRGEPLDQSVELPFYPGRVLLQDFTGVPVIVDLTAMRTAAVGRGLPAARINPVVPVDLIIDHSVQVDSAASGRSIQINLDREYERNSERYQLLRWAQQAYRNVRVVPPGNGICHQVNLEYMAEVVVDRPAPDGSVLFPDTLIGTDSHTTMVNGLGVLGWGGGGIEAEAVMMGEPYYLSAPTIVGVRLSGSLPEGATATDLVLTVTRALRQHGVVDKFVEFFGPGVAHLAVPDRATISNMCPEYGATAALFPIDDATTRYLTSTGRSPEAVERVRQYAQLQHLWNTGAQSDLEFDEVVEIDLGLVVPTISGPKNPEESVALSEAAPSFRSALAAYRKERPVRPDGATLSPPISDGSVVIAAITSCTNTSNPSVMVGAGLIAQRAVQRGLSVRPGVKTSMAPGSKVVTEYLRRAGLMPALVTLGFDVVGYGCTTCIGNSGPLAPTISQQITDGELYVAAVLSGNRNFEARIQNLVRANYLASPMLVVAYALAGRMDVDLTREPLGSDREGHPVFLRDLWPTSAEVRALVESSLDPSIFTEKYRSITQGDAHWEHLTVPTGEAYPWVASSTYLRNPPYFELPAIPPEPSDGVLARGARVLVALGDRVSTDHISPAGEIPIDSPAGRYLLDQGVAVEEFNTYGTRRGNHEVMVRATFANVRIKNQLVAPKEGGYTLHVPSGATTSVYEAALRYQGEGTPLIVLAGASYGQGSSRDWAAKGPLLLGVRAVIAESYERIHRSNLVGMRVLPLQFLAGQGWKKLGLTGRESFTLRVRGGLRPRGEVEVVVEAEAHHEVKRFNVTCRIDSEIELAYYRAGGLLPFVLNKASGA